MSSQMVFIRACEGYARLNRKPITDTLHVYQETNSNSSDL